MSETQKNLQEQLLTFLRNVGGLITTLAVIYGFLWTIGLAPITNSQASYMIKTETKSLQASVDELQTQVKILHEQNSNLYSELRIQRDLQNQILLQLRHR